MLCCHHGVVARICTFRILNSSAKGPVRINEERLVELVGSPRVQYAAILAAVRNPSGEELFGVVLYNRDRFGTTGNAPEYEGYVCGPSYSFRIVNRRRSRYVSWFARCVRCPRSYRAFAFPGLGVFSAGFTIFRVLYFI
jgi:hypothetical protein